MGQARRRYHAGYRDRLPSGRRAPRGMLRYDNIEWATITAAAAIEGLTPGAWAQQAAFDAAADVNSGPVADRAAVTELLDELRQHRRQLAAIGNNLNQLTMIAHATGQISARPAEVVLRMVRDVVRTSDAVQVQLLTQLLNRRR